MHIDLPQTEQEKLTQQAMAAGFDDVKLFIAEHLVALAHQPAREDFAPLSDEELEASLAMIDRSMEEFSAGGGLTLDQAREKSLELLKRNLL